jgi:hypothetical protein
MRLYRVGGHGETKLTDEQGGSWETRRSSLSTERKGASGNVLRRGLSSAKASLTTRCVVACSRGLATLSSHCCNWPFKSSRLRNEPARKKSSRMYRYSRSTLPLVLAR